MEREFVAEQWLHKKCRSPKEDRNPAFNGRGWECRRCGCQYLVNAHGCTYEEALKFFWQFITGVGF
jgi:hypothetical protein